MQGEVSMDRNLPGTVLNGGANNGLVAWLFVLVANGQSPAEFSIELGLVPELKDAHWLQVIGRDGAAQSWGDNVIGEAG